MADASQYFSVCINRTNSPGTRVGPGFRDRTLYYVMPKYQGNQNISFLSILEVGEKHRRVRCVQSTTTAIEEERESALVKKKEQLKEKMMHFF